MIASASSNPPVKQLKGQKQCDYCGKWVKHLKKHLAIHRMAQIECDVCRKSFSTERGYRRHRILYCDVLRCPHCKRGLHEIDAYRSHIEEHKRELNLECPFCAREFGATRSLRLHVKNVHKCTVIFRCLKCNFSTPDFAGYESHVAIHARNSKLYGCNHCAFVSEKRRVCTAHINAEHDVRETCVVCEESFRNIFDLQDHNLKMHENWKCEHCGLTCGNLATYKGHLRRHKKENYKPKHLKCPVCNKDFQNKKKSYRKHLFEHKLSNSSFKCEYCTRAFTRERALEYHVDHMHKSRDGFLCLICNYSTQSSDDYKLHISNHNDVQ